MTMVEVVDGPLRVSLPAAQRQLEPARIVWPLGGHPAAFDEAAATLYDCFVEPVTVSDLADDFAYAFDIERIEAVNTVLGFAAGLLSSGHLIPDGMNPMPVAILSYPPGPSI